MSAEVASALPRRPSPMGARALVALALLAAGVWASLTLELQRTALWPGAGGLELARDFLGRALSPALRYEARFVPSDAPPLLSSALTAAVTTLRYALAAMGLALILGVVLGALASASWWGHDLDARTGRRSSPLTRAAAFASYVATRALIAVLRSIHELIWAILFLAALGRSEAVAILAIALPFGGALAKVYSEIIDEVPRQCADALRHAGASRAQVLCFGLLPAALPDMTAYTFYRLECALRSSAILGFFGFPTLGLFIRQSFNSTNYGEVWTYLYALIALIVLFDAWSGHVRRRLTQ